MKKIWFCIPLFLAVMIVNAVRDINLQDEIINLVRHDLPEVSLQKINFDREIYGARWIVSIVSLDRKGGFISISSFDAAREEPDGTVARFKSDKAVYDESSKVVDFPEGGKITWVIKISDDP